ncbi:MAG: asparagine synthase (glutamine-hydrolyzing) [Candidatus Omnitrophota bacterium]
MCGICGAIYRDNTKKVPREWVKQMADTMRHRGPDDEGFFVEGNVGLGQRRLSIIDISSGHQPIFNEDNSLCIVFNGEIYNYQNLRIELIKRGHSFSTKSDTEVVVHAYEEYGPDCVKKLHGMFAFAIWDKRSKHLMLARDRVGKKPLYFYRDDNVFLFASEIKAILKTGIVRAKVHKPVLDFYLSLGYTPGPETVFENIFKLEPAHYMLMSENGKTDTRGYWDIAQMEPIDISFEDAREKTKNLLVKSVEMRLMSEVPLGVFLSGGLDSSAIVALMSDILGKTVQTFSVGYKDVGNMSELGFANIVASRFNTQHHEFILTPEDLFSSIDTLLEHSGEPIVESAAIALYKLASLAKPHATVLLSGEGSDEIFAGYSLYSKMYRIESMRRFLRFVPFCFIAKAMVCMSKQEKMCKYFEWMAEPFERRYRSVSYDLTESIKNRMYSPALKNVVDKRQSDYFAGLHDRVSGKSMLSKMLYIDTKSWLAEDILLKSDRMTMAASVELRAPFLDHELIEFVTSLPDSYKLNGAIGKHILKEAMKDLLPEKVINRKKMGFPVPLSAWFGGALYDNAKSLLTEKRTLERGYFNRAYIDTLFENIKKNEDLGRRIFSFVTLELWHRKYID